MTVAFAGAAAPWSSSCGVCGRAERWGTADPELVKARARARGWRWTNEFGLCCPTCSLGSPGLYVLEENARRIRDRKVSDRELAPSRADRTPQHPRNAEKLFREPTVRGFGAETPGQILERLGIQLEDGEDSPEE